MKFMSARPIILASASPRRKEILSLLGLPFTALPSHVSEDIDMISDDFGAYARELASRKTMAIAKDYGDHIVIGADTIVVHEGKHYPKPASPAQAKTFLQALSGKTHTVITGVGVCMGGTLRVFAVETAVTFRELDDVLIDAYVESGDPMDKAGGYGIQTAGALLVDKIDGDYFNVMGLPIAKLTEHLRRYALIALKEGDPYIDY